MYGLRAAICRACRVYNTLPCADASIIGGDGIRFFRTHGENTIIICPVQPDGARSAFVMAEDVCLTASDSNACPVHVRTQIRLDSGNGDIAIAYMLDGAGSAPKEIHVRVYICGVLLVDMRVLKTFSARTHVQLHSKHELERGNAFCTAFHPAGTHVATTFLHYVNVYTLPDFKFVGRLGEKGTGKTELIRPHDLCFTEAGTLLVVDFGNDRVQHWDLNGEWIATYSAFSRKPHRIAACGDMLVVGCYCGVVRVFSQKSDFATEWCCKHTVTAVTFVDATTLAIATLDNTIGLYTLEGTTMGYFASDIVSFGLAVCADGCLLVSDYERKRVRVFSTTGDELDTAPFSAYSFEISPLSIGLCLDRAYVFEQLRSGAPRVCMFE